MNAPLRTPRQRRGHRAENAAAAFLQRQGLVEAARNYRCRFGELDLVMRDGSTLVFVEVRFRGSGAFVSGPASVTPDKQRRLIRAAEHFVVKRRIADDTRMRFDVVGVRDAGVHHECEWIRDAFRTDELADPC